TGERSSTSITSPGISGLRYRNSSPLTGLPSLSYQNSLILRPAIEPVAEGFFTLKVVTTSSFRRLVTGLVMLTGASPRIGGTNFAGAAGGVWAGAAGFARPASGPVANRTAGPQGRSI